MRSWAEIDLEAVRHNFLIVRKRLAPGTRVMAVVKADAYGHGAVEVARCLKRAGCEAFGVADALEGEELRRAEIAGPIVVLGALTEEEIPVAAANDVSVTVHSPDLLWRLNAEAERHGRTIGVHLKIDTGMSRLGAEPAGAVKLVGEILRFRSLRLDGVSTHLPTSNPVISRGQLGIFCKTVDQLRNGGTELGRLHAANSVNLFHVPESHFDMVRPGIALYGLNPGALGAFDLRPALSLRTRIVTLKSVAPGTGVGYQRTFVARRPTKIATCPIGYNDGLPYRLSNRAHALVRGRRAPIVGSVTMDYIMLDVTDVPGVRAQDVATLIGGDGRETVRAEQLAETAGTIPYAITCGLGRRIRRIYREEKRGGAGLGSVAAI